MLVSVNADLEVIMAEPLVATSEDPGIPKTEAERTVEHDLTALEG